MLTARTTVDILPIMDEKKILLRMPQELYERIDAMAKAERRTVTAQIVYVLERTIPPKGDSAKQSAEATSS